MVRSASDPLALVGPLRRILHDMDPDLPIFNVQDDGRARAGTACSA